MKKILYTLIFVSLLLSSFFITSCEIDIGNKSEKNYHIYLMVNTGATIETQTLELKIGDSYDITPEAVGLTYDTNEYRFNGWKIEGTNDYFSKTGTRNYTHDITLNLVLRSLWPEPKG